MRVVVTSDFHGVVPTDDVEPCELLVLAGDCLGRDDYLSRLGVWLGRQPAKRIVGIAGNHDPLTPETEARVRELPWTFLHDEATTIEDSGRPVVVYGSPWSVTFGGWSFMANDADLAERWARIPDETEVLVVHGPAARINDKVGDRSVGSVTLRERVERLSRLRLLATGHIHEAYGVTPVPRPGSRGQVEWWLAVNGSYVGGNFRTGQPPLAVTI